jgi:integrin beta 3
MTAEELHRLIASLAPAVHQVVTKAVTSLTDRLLVLEQRLATVRDGRDGLMGPMGPQGEKGLDGRDGQDGRHGLDGTDGAPGPMGERGPQGEWGLDGRDGRDGKDGVDGRPGERGERGEKGLDGAPGFNLTDFSTDYDGERRVTLRFVQGDRIQEHTLVFPFQLDRGVYQAGRVYERGDSVTWGGSSWIAQVDAPPGKPGDPESGWRLAVKRGADGKTGPEGKSGPAGPRGEKGDPGPRVY